MTFTAEAIEAVSPATALSEPSQFDLPVKEFVGYDPKGTTTVTGSPIQRPAPQAEAATEETSPVTPEETVTLSREISAIARKEQAHRQREMKLKQRERELEARLADADKYRALRTKLDAKDYSAADELGMTYEEYTQYLLKKQEGVKPEEERYRKVESELQKLKGQHEEIIQKEYQANQKLWQAEIKGLVATGDDYSTIRELGAEHLVLQHVNDSFEEDGIELTAEQAAKEIEEGLLADAEKKSAKYSSLSKLKSRTEAPAKTLGAPKSAPKTITQSMTVTSQKQPSKPFHLMSESEQLAEAMRRVQAAKLQR